MSKVTSEKKYISFVKGLITEANALTFPENASLDEDNFDLKLNGSRVRRLGLDYESGYSLKASGVGAAQLEGTKTSFHKWPFPGGSTTVSIGVIRVYDKLFFINLLATAPSASFLNGGSAITISGLANSELDTVSINNLLILVSKDLDWPIVLTYDPTTDVVSQEEYPIQVRDIWGVVDGLELNERPATSDPFLEADYLSLSETHIYNLMNQGWSMGIDCVASALDTEPIPWPTRAYKYSTALGWAFISLLAKPIIKAIYVCGELINSFPSNTDVWTLGKIGVTTSADYQKFDPVTLRRNSLDNAEAPKGTNIIDAFKRGYSRYLLSILSTLPLDEEQGRITTVAAFAGRVCYAGITSSVSDPDGKSPNYSGFVFFSQTVTGKDKLGKCYQEADPTSPTISDIVDTDGGTIQFPEISSICKLVAVKDSLLIFAENGIWEIYGDTGGFKATSFQVAKISSVGTTNTKSIVVTGSSVVYWAKAGIFVATANPQTGRFSVENISITTIQTYYNSISDLSKKYARGFFDEKENHVRWIYNDNNNYSETINVNHYNRQLNLDLSIQAFYKHSFSSLATNSPSVVDFVEIPSYAISSVNSDVYVGSDNVLSVTDQVQVPIDNSAARIESYSYLTFVGQSFTLSNFNSSSFMDWETADGVGANYSSYLITGYETFGDIMRSKMVPYIFFYFNRTEDGFSSVGGNLIANNPSSCLVQAQWNWSNSAESGKWGTQFQAYRYTRNYVPSGVGDLFDTGDALIVTKNKLRGCGKDLSLKIQSEQGKDMQLLGWGLIVTGNGTP